MTTAHPAEELPTTQFPCEQCGATLTFTPGDQSLSCGYCGHVNPILHGDDEVIVEHDFQQALAEGRHVDDVELGDTFKCQACAAEVERPPNTSAQDCPFCGHSMVIDHGSTRRIRPESLLPFAITDRQAQERFSLWIKGKFFAPSALKRSKVRYDRLIGLYLPWWTYDSDVTTNYTGQRGEHYYVTVPYTYTDGKGRVKTGTRQERRTRWWPASGTVFNRFDDLLVSASATLPDDLRAKIGGWDLQNLVPFKEGYLSGFRAEVYQRGLPEGFQVATGMMVPTIRQTIHSDIGGDEQRIHSMHSHYANITWKHLLLPLWLSSYPYKGKVYRFAVNGRSGQVAGDYPVSYWKVFFVVLAVLAVLGLIGGGIWLYQSGGF